MSWGNQVERAFIATLGSSAFHPDGEVPKDPPTHQHNKVLVEWKWGQMATKNDWNYLTYTNLMFKLAIKNGAKHKCIPPRQNHGFWLSGFAEASGSGDRWQMDRLENPKRFVMTLRWPSFEEVSIYFRRKNIFVESVHNKENILKLEWPFFYFR